MTLPTRPTSPVPSTTHPRPRALRSFLKPYRSTLLLASGLTLVETLLDLARPWPLKVAVDNAIGGRPLGGPLAFLDGMGPAGLAAVAALGGIALVGIGGLIGYLITYLTSAAAADPGGPADLQGRRRRPGRGGDRGAAQRPGRPGVHPRTRGRGPVRRAQPRGRAGRAGRHGPGGTVVAGGRPAAGGRGRPGAVAGG